MPFRRVPGARLPGAVSLSLAVAQAQRLFAAGRDRAGSRAPAGGRWRGRRGVYFLNKLNHRSTNTGLGSTTSAPRGGDINDKEREVRAGRSIWFHPSDISTSRWRYQRGLHTKLIIICIARTSPVLTFLLCIRIPVGGLAAALRAWWWWPVRGARLRSLPCASPSRRPQRNPPPLGYRRGGLLGYRRGLRSLCRRPQRNPPPLGYRSVSAIPGNPWFGLAPQRLNGHAPGIGRDAQGRCRVAGCRPAHAPPPLSATSMCLF